MFLLRSFCFTENLCLELDTEVTHVERETEKRSSSRQRARARERERINQSYDMACVYIPVQNSEEEVRVALDMLPRDAADILDILKAEQAPLDLWLIIAVSSLTFYFNFPQIHSNFSLVLAIVVILFIYLFIFVNDDALQREYFKQGKVEQFRQILEEGSGPGNFVSDSMMLVRLFFILFDLVI